MTPEENLASLGITLPPVATPIANYVPSVRTGNLLFVSGNGPSDDLPNRAGKLGADLTVEQGYAVARDVGIKLIASIQDAVGDLSRVKRIVKLLGMVNSAPDFADQPAVINGCSDLLVAVFGDAGKHARSAVGMGALPGDIAVEIELIAEVE
ncbi:MAG: RidA family protein [Chloroflexota bacterium]|nr:RidA family protein [Chloroflexota bacterium]